MKNTVLARALTAGVGLALVAPAMVPAAQATPAAQAAEVHIPDDGFRACLNAHLGHPAEAQPTASELASIQDLECNDHPRAREYRIQDLTGAEHLTGAASITVRHNDIRDLTPLAGLIGLEDLHLGQNEVTEVSALSGLTGLRSLNLADNSITDASALAGLRGQFEDGGLTLGGQHLQLTAEVGEPVALPPVLDSTGQLLAATCTSGLNRWVECAEPLSLDEHGTTFTPEAPDSYRLTFDGTGQDGYSLDAWVKVSGGPDPDHVVFTDNPVGSDFYAPIQWMAAERISVGYADGTFRKNRAVSRGETAQLVYRMTGQTTVATEDPFRDVRRNFRDAVAWFAEEEITRGYADGTFRPGRPVTRGEFATFLYRLHQPDGVETPQEGPFTDEGPFKDVDPRGTHGAAISWAAAAGITRGYTDGVFKPHQQISRGQAAAFLHRYSELGQ